MGSGIIGGILGLIAAIIIALGITSYFSLGPGSSFLVGYACGFVFTFGGFGWHYGFGTRYRRVNEGSLCRWQVQ